MISRTWARLSLLLSMSACGGLAGCSNSGGSGPSSSSNSSSTTISPAQVTALQAIVQRAQPPKGMAPTPIDTPTSRVAAQITELEHDQSSALGTAYMLALAEKDPANSATSAQLEIYRQKELAIAAADLAEISAIVGRTKLPGSPYFAIDGGAGLVLGAIVAQSFATQAQAYLKAGEAAGAAGGAGPSSDEISTFLQEEAIVTSDEGNGGHDVSGRVVAYALLNDASVTSITSSVDGGVH